MHFNLSLKRIVLFLLFLIAVILILGHYKIFFRLVYPFFYRDLIYESATTNQLDPYLVAAVIHAESKFNIYATSSQGARGLMQIMPATGHWIAQELKDDSFSAQDLYEPETNISYGCWYLSWLEDKFEGNLVLVLAAYNGGPGNVDEWLEMGKWDGKEETIEKIPLTETRNYVRKVLDLHSRYEYIYE